MATIAERAAEHIYNELLHVAGLAWADADRALLARIAEPSDPWAVGYLFGARASAERLDDALEYAGGVR